jgi:hypothetical protein
MMKTTIGLLVLGGFFLISCEEDPVVQVSGFQAQPILHSIIETRDSVHFIRIGRMFAGSLNPEISARVHDSIYFDSVGLKVTLTSMSGKKVDVPVEGRMVGNKDEGFFNSGDYMVYWFYQHISSGYVKGVDYVQFFKQILIEASFPGLPVVRCSTDLLPIPMINSPKRAQQYIYIVPESPLRIQWEGGDWNEIIVSFSILEEYPDSSATRTFQIHKSDGLLYNKGTLQQYCELKVPYDLIVQILDNNLVYRADLIRRHFGAFRMEVHTGNKDFDIYRQFIGGINDFNYMPWDNIENGIGILSSRSSTIKTAVYLDSESLMQFVLEPKLKKFKFVAY